MYISLQQIKQSLEALEDCHPYFGISFLVNKAADLPVGHAVEFHADAEEFKFMEKYYKPDRGSTHFYRVFRPSDKKRHWLRGDYPSSGSQSTRTKRGFVEAVIYEPGKAIWGWKPNYVARLQKMLRRGLKVPAFHLAVWLYREFEWPKEATAEDIGNKLRKEFRLTEPEIENLYSPGVPVEVDQSRIFAENIVTWKDLRRVIGSPPDASPEEGGTLTHLALTDIGPVHHAQLSLGDRLNLVTGDNGLGKTFLLECAWWALTGEWAGLPANPSPYAKPGDAKIAFEIKVEAARPEPTRPTSIPYNWQTLSWPSRLAKRPTIPGLLVYARVDGSFAVWDPVRAFIAASSRIQNGPRLGLVITKEQVWDGLAEPSGVKTQTYINGLLRDWITWQNSPDRYPFDLFRRVLRRLSPQDLGLLEPGKPVRLPSGDVREIPTVRHVYGETPIIHAAAGVRRIIALAYLVVWAWEEHRIQSELLRKQPQRRMVIMIDEVEAHLHPKWQRTILPAVLGLGDELSSDLKVQFLVATHSPLVMVSLEGLFDDKIDKLFHIGLFSEREKAPQVMLKEVEFIKQGRVDTWLTSDLFEFQQARSREAEKAIEEAKSLQLMEHPSLDDVRRITETLLRLLPSDDDFWPRWKYFAENNGVQL
jgi:hypothetical protein